MRVLPVNNYNFSLGLTKNRKSEKPTVDSVQKGDTVSFKRSYEVVYQEALKKNVSSFATYSNLFKELVHSLNNFQGILISRTLGGAMIDKFDTAYSTYKSCIKSPLEEQVLFKTKDGRPLVVVNQESIDFYALDNDYVAGSLEPYNGDYIRFNKDSNNDYCLSRPCREIIIWGTTGNLREDIGYVSGLGDGISHHRFYNRDGSSNGWKNFLFGS